MSADERSPVRTLLSRHGWNTTSFQVLESTFRYYFPDEEAVVAYVETRSARVAAGAPICSADRLADVARALAVAASRAGRRAAFFATERRLIEAAGLHSLLIGERPVWDSRVWSLTLEATASQRALARARNKGVRVREVSLHEVESADAPLRRRLEGLIRDWSRSRAMAPMGFLVEIEPSPSAGSGATSSPKRTATSRRSRDRSLAYSDGRATSQRACTTSAASGVSRPSSVRRPGSPCIFRIRGP